MGNLIIFIVILSAVLVYFDSKKYKEANLTGSSFSWAGLIFLFWLPAFPIYLILKFLKYEKQLKDPNYTPNKLIINLSIIFVVIIFIFATLFYFLKIANQSGFLK